MGLMTAFCYKVKNFSWRQFRKRMWVHLVHRRIVVSHRSNTVIDKLKMAPGCARRSISTRNRDGHESLWFFSWGTMHIWFTHPQREPNGILKEVRSLLSPDPRQDWLCMLVKWKLKRVLGIVLWKCIRGNTLEMAAMLWNIRPTGFWNNLAAPAGLSGDSLIQRISTFLFTLWQMPFFCQSVNRDSFWQKQHWCAVQWWDGTDRLAGSLWDFMVGHENKHLLVWTVVTAYTAILVNRRVLDG